MVHSSTEQIQYPCNYDGGKSCQAFCQEVEVDSTTWQRVQQLVQTAELVVTGIERIHNRRLLQTYVEHRHALRRSKQVPPEDLEAVNAERAAAGMGRPLPDYQDNEALLLHKPRSNKDLFEIIAENGLVAGTHKEKSGRGIIFSDSLAKCSKFGSGDKALVCLVTLGDCVEETSGMEGVIERCGINETPPKKRLVHRRSQFDFRFDSWLARTDANEYSVRHGMQVLPLYIVTYVNIDITRQLMDLKRPWGLPPVIRPVPPVLLPVPDFVVGPPRLEADRVLHTDWGNAAGSNEEAELAVLCQPPSPALGALNALQECLEVSERHQEGMERLWRLHATQGPAAFVEPAFSVELATADSSCPICYSQIPQGTPMARLPCCPNAVFHFSPECFSGQIVEGSTMSGVSTVGIKCPCCRADHGVATGYCPDGRMQEQEMYIPSVGPVIHLSFDIAADISSFWGPCWPAREVSACLPASAESRAVLRNLRRAFELRHCRFELSDSTGLADVYIGTTQLWSPLDIAMPFSSLDPEYVSRVDEALQAALGRHYQPPSLATEVLPLGPRPPAVGVRRAVDDIFRPAVPLDMPPSQREGVDVNALDYLPEYIPSAESSAGPPAGSHGGAPSGSGEEAPRQPAGLLRDAALHGAEHLIEDHQRVLMVVGAVIVAGGVRWLRRRLVARLSK